MSRYTGPRVKIMRALGTELPGLSAKKTERRPYPPGQHGQARKKLSEYALRLREKQKLRLNYGLTDRQLRNLMIEARGSDMAAGAKLIELLERRLDNVVFRAGFARTIPAARQLVTHGHVLVDGKRVDIVSYRLRAGQTVSLREKSRAHQTVETGLARKDLEAPTWLSVDKDTRSARVASLPDETSIPFAIEVQLIIEFYSQRL
ncbi:30S ribosomal protein S4 [Chondromyces apiculatus]|uniref:Small ribosomal subunit protein uS4 n=1 Tax=Chondromyces apiculatus DSM 436 TaxID=1192034 RepID=A0A017TAF7_9BACT|nr:30S ribosomal protein S4 [Chondromyces apiculatus]EYF06219.1 SSU ribosomal protein S4p (S9e) [Chondromyces apiculatus DSM 436]